jgi:hypothetical protein
MYRGYFEVTVDSALFIQKDGGRKLSLSMPYVLQFQAKGENLQTEEFFYERLFLVPNLPESDEETSSSN